MSGEGNNRKNEDVYGQSLDGQSGGEIRAARSGEDVVLKGDQTWLSPLDGDGGEKSYEHGERGGGDS